MDKSDGPEIHGNNDGDTDRSSPHNAQVFAEDDQDQSNNHQFYGPHPKSGMLAHDIPNPGVQFGGDPSLIHER
ncbi:MAG: hypothetical protein AAF939_22000 [Planctomycetota bacterium]